MVSMAPFVVSPDEAAINGHRIEVRSRVGDVQVISQQSMITSGWIRPTLAQLLTNSESAPPTTTYTGPSSI